MAEIKRGRWPLNGARLHDVGSRVAGESEPPQPRLHLIQLLSPPSLSPGLRMLLQTLRHAQVSSFTMQLLS